jgi:hypothetical protein
MAGVDGGIVHRRNCHTTVALTAIAVPLRPPASSLIGSRCTGAVVIIGETDINEPLLAAEQYQRKRVSWPGRCVLSKLLCS